MMGFKEKLVDLTDDQKREYWDRVKKELNVLEEKNFSSYMLIVADFINWAKDQKMPTGPARGCFIPGSMVVMGNGTKRKIEDISIGDVVISHDGSHQQVINTLEYSVDEEIVELTFENGVIIKCTKEHEFFTSNRGWVHANELTDDDDVVYLI
jgi:hypothetical protein